MAFTYYRQRESPGCGGCFLVLLLILLLGGGAPLVLQFMGSLVVLFLSMPLLALLAFVAFTWYVRSQVSRYEKSQTELHNRFVILLVHILVRIAQIDGVATKEELDIITRFFRDSLHYNQQQMLWVKEILKDALRPGPGLEAYLSEFRGQFGYEPRLILVDLIHQVLYVKTEVPARELELAETIARYLEISSWDLNSIRSRFTLRARRVVSEEERAFETLGLAAGTPFEEAKKAYRKLSMQYHPDKVSHLGEEFRKVAEEKMKEINAAYQVLKDRYER